MAQQGWFIFTWRGFLLISCIALMIISTTCRAGLVLCWSALFLARAWRVRGHSYQKEAWALAKKQCGPARKMDRAFSELDEAMPAGKNIVLDALRCEEQGAQMRSAMLWGCRAAHIARSFVRYTARVCGVCR